MLAFSCLVLGRSGAIQNNAAWNGVWKSIDDARKNSHFEAGVPAGSAAVLRFTIHMPSH
jgi:hypothetical protein